MNSNFDIRKFLAENRLTQVSRTLSEGYSDSYNTSVKVNPNDLAKILDFVYSHPIYEGLPQSALEEKIEDYKIEWEHVQDEYSSIDEYLDEIEGRGDFLEEGLRVDFSETGEASSITLSRKAIEGEQANTKEGVKTYTSQAGFKVYWSLEADSPTPDTKAAYDALKHRPELLDLETLAVFIRPVIQGFAKDSLSYVGYLESEDPLSKLLAQAVNKVHPSAKLIPISKIQYKYLEDAIDYEQYRRESPAIQRTIDAEKEAIYKKQPEGPYVLKKKDMFTSKVLDRTYGKYDLGLNKYYNDKEYATNRDRELPSIYQAIASCIIDPRKKLLIVDDNIFTGSDFNQIFEVIKEAIGKKRLDYDPRSPIVRDIDTAHKRIAGYTLYKLNSKEINLQKQMRELNFNTGFDLKKFLVENKLTSNSRRLSEFFEFSPEETGERFPRRSSTPGYKTSAKVIMSSANTDGMWYDRSDREVEDGFEGQDYIEKTFNSGEYNQFARFVGSENAFVFGKSSSRAREMFETYAPITVRKLRQGMNEYFPKEEELTDISSAVKLYVVDDIDQSDELRLERTSEEALYSEYKEQHGEEATEEGGYYFLKSNGIVDFGIYEGSSSAYIPVDGFGTEGKRLAALVKAGKNDEAVTLFWDIYSKHFKA